jgi:aspartokinase
VSHTSDVSVLKIYATGVGDWYGVLSVITDRLTSHNINIKSVITSQTCISLLLSKKDIEKSLEIIKKIKPEPFRKLSANKDVALVSIVGEGLSHNRSVAAKYFSSVSTANS